MFNNMFNKPGVNQQQPQQQQQQGQFMNQTSMHKFGFKRHRQFQQ